MKPLKTALATTALIALATTALATIPTAHAAPASDKLGAGLTMYFQMGGSPGDGSTLPREIGAKAAAKAFGVKLIEQYSNWQPETMITQFRQALAASPDCIEIMGHPGNRAFMPLVAQAEKQGIVVTAGNVPLPKLQALYRANGFGYAGTYLFKGGETTAEAMIKAGHLKKGDVALEYGVFAEGIRGLSDKGLAHGLKKAGLKVYELNISNKVNADPALAVPIMVAFIERHPNIKAIGTQQGLVTSFIPQALKEAGKKPGQITVGGIDLAPATIAGLKSHYITVTLNQQLYLQGFLPVAQCVLTKKFGLEGMNTNTAAGTDDAAMVSKILPLIKQGVY
ncbi:substrate-binding domain-containing protein [Acidiphilium acidophilum]|uniref:substrate-binding domain-containing protein n=1 Tax=Acidiphilium acidophilum TaxID=76588 RepID=UPI002E8E7136|nr:substrate-binding domain-containing protein [Acidiphilium acidophilum]